MPCSPSDDERGSTVDIYEELQNSECIDGPQQQPTVVAAGATEHFPAPPNETPTVLAVEVAQEVVEASDAFNEVPGDTRNEFVFKFDEQPGEEDA